MRRDIGKLPHVLIAGTTGSGKSVCTNSLIVSILYKSTPEEVRFIMVDPKMVELAPYNGIPHLLIPVVTDPKKAAGALQWAVFEMMKRYKLFSEHGVKDLAGYNALARQDGELKTMPTVVVVIDELADLMLVAAKEVEESICRVAQMGRAAGMHLVIATQRPSSDVITGLMKANIPSRIAFAVASSLESRIILDTTGAEKLVGKGDMLYAPLGAGKPTRVQGCFITPEEIERVVGFVKTTGEAEYSREVIEMWTKIPASKIKEEEFKRLAELDVRLKQHIVGQDEAVDAVSAAIRRSRVGISPKHKPVSFIFVGSTGVGKTELVKQLANQLFDGPDPLIRLDMSEYMEKYAVSRMIGSPPGYVGYEEAGQLTEKVRRRPYSVVLFDEVEKAHPDVFNILLQVLDDGRITDSQGRTVDFKNTVIILTSNLGSDIILNDLEQRRANGSNELSEEAKHQIDQLLKSKFRPEFLNRLDEIVYYKSLTKDEMRRIVDLQLQDLRKRMDEGKHLKLEVTTAAKDFIIDSAYDSVYGARPIKRFIQSRVETLIAKAIIQGSYTEGNTLTVDCENGALTLR